MVVGLIIYTAIFFLPEEILIIPGQIKFLL
jgi:hypothetical protein